MARAALNWGLRDLAAAAGVAQGTVIRLETGESGLRASSLTVIRLALEKAGVRFVEMEDGMVGVVVAETPGSAAVSGASTQQTD